MAYGGAALGPPAASGVPSTIRQVKLDKESELRVEVADAPFRLRLLNGSAEIFGTEIPPEIWLSFPPRMKFAVCKLLSYSSILDYIIMFLLFKISLLIIHKMVKYNV